MYTPSIWTREVKGKTGGEKQSQGLESGVSHAVTQSPFGLASFWLFLGKSAPWLDSLGLLYFPNTLAPSFPLIPVARGNRQFFLLAALPR